VSSAVRGRLRSVLAAISLSALVVLTGCGGGASDDQGGPQGQGQADAGGHDHSGGGAPATVEGPDDEYAGLDLAEPYRRPTFTLTDTTGASFDFKAATSGRPTLLFFGYTNCPDVCPTTMADIAVALRGVDAALVEDLQVVFVTTDPATDTPEVLGEYLGRFDADLPVPFIGLTGDQAAIDQAQLSTGVPLAEDQGRLHSSLLLLYGTDDEAHVAFDAGNTARDIAADLRLVAGTA
jgi:protein SCO1/2